MPESLVSLRAYESGPHRAGKKYEQIKQELAPPKPQEPSEPPVPVTPLAELEEMKAAIVRLEAGLLQTGEEVTGSKTALAKAQVEIDAERTDLTQLSEGLVMRAC